MQQELLKLKYTSTHPKQMDRLRLNPNVHHLPTSPESQDILDGAGLNCLGGLA
jgi:hypothetical protein